MNALPRPASPMLLLSACAVSGCAIDATGAADDDVLAESDDALTNPQDGYLFVQGDTRACAAPGCGGWYVRRANATKTRCADVSSAPECYVAALDLRALGLTDDEVASFEQKARGRQGALLRGKLATRSIGSRRWGVLTATEAWLGKGNADPRGTEGYVRGGARVVRAPGKAPCGCDGRTYPSACLARIAGMAIEHPGACQ